MTAHERTHSIRAGIETDPLTAAEAEVARIIIVDGVGPLAEAVEALNPEGRAVVGLCFNIIARVIAGGHHSVKGLR